MTFRAMLGCVLVSVVAAVGAGSLVLLDDNRGGQNGGLAAGIAIVLAATAFVVVLVASVVVVVARASGKAARAEAAARKSSSDWGPLLWAVGLPALSGLAIAETNLTGAAAGPEAYRAAFAAGALLAAVVVWPICIIYALVHDLSARRARSG